MAEPGEKFMKVAAKETNAERRDRELKQMGTGEDPKKPRETAIEYAKRMKKLKNDNDGDE